MNSKLEDISPALTRNYLLEKLNITPALLFLTIFLLYDSNYERYLFAGSSLVITILSLLIFLKTRRILIYLFIVTWLFIVLSQTVFITSNNTQDMSADRDDAVELAANNLLKGKNPWLSKTILDLPITTGPASILIAIPSILLTGKVNLLTFFFWILFFCILIGADIYNKNNSFLYLFLLFLLPIFRFQHTILYSLEEIYYFLLLLPLLLKLLKIRMFIYAGILFSILILSRLSYIYLCFGIYVWMTVDNGLSIKDNLMILTGFFCGAICILFPFVLVSGSTIIDSNFIINSFVKTDNILQNQFFNLVKTNLFSSYYLNQIFISILVCILVLLFNFCLSRTNQNNPYWTISFASLVAFTIIFTPFNPNDYILSILIPLFFGIAFNAKEKLITI